MRMDTTCGISAREWLKQASVQEMTWVLQHFGEERFAKRISQAIFHQNRRRLITSTSELAKLITTIVPWSNKHKHPATRSFQAIRIYINNELKEIEQVLNSALNILAIGGKLVVISFHSLEDRLVKYFINKHSKLPLPPTGISLTEKQIADLYKNRHLTLKNLGKIRPSIQEIKVNPRARSALLRFAEKLDI